MTLPLICALNRATKEDRNQMERVISDKGLAEEEFDTILDLINRYGGMTYTRERAREHIDQAKTYLDVFEASKTCAILKDLADYVLVRNI